MKKRWLLIGLSLLVAIGLGVPYLGKQPVYMGGGQYKESPDGKFVAHAGSLRNIAWFATDKRPFCEFAVLPDATRPPPIVDRCGSYPPENSNENHFRTLPQIISWPADSATVTFSIPGMTLTLDILEHPSP